MKYLLRYLVFLTCAMPIIAFITGFVIMATNMPFGWWSVPILLIYFSVLTPIACLIVHFGAAVQKDINEDEGFFEKRIKEGEQK